MGSKGSKAKGKKNQQNQQNQQQVIVQPQQPKPAQAING